MKRISIFGLLAILCLINLNLEAQIQIQNPNPEVIVGKCKNGAYTQAQLSYVIQQDKDTLYTFLFLNAKYSTLTDYQSIVFSGENNTINDFYSVLKSFFSDENKKNKDYKVEFKLGATQVIASNLRIMGVTSVMILTSKGHVYLTEKQVDKVFGKN